jgi:hypothetical protein
MRAEFDAELRRGSADFAASLSPPSASAVRDRGDRRRRRRVVGSTAVGAAVAVVAGSAVVARADRDGDTPAAAGAGGSISATASKGVAAATPANSPIGATVSTSPGIGAAPVPVAVTIDNRGPAVAIAAVEVVLSFPKRKAAGLLNSSAVVTSIDRFYAVKNMYERIAVLTQKAADGTVDVGVFSTRLPTGVTSERLQVFTAGLPFDVSLRVITEPTAVKQVLTAQKLGSGALLPATPTTPVSAYAGATPTTTG